jgi:hypothetical protein
VKCSVCAQDVPEGRYSDHLESEHGVTNDPTAVLIQHLTGLRSAAGEGDGDEELPDEEPSDADAFEEFLAASPAKSPAADEEEDHEAAHDEKEPDEAPAPVDTEKQPEPEGDADTADDGAELTDEDEAEFERMLAVYPEVDLRKGRPPTAVEPAQDPAETTAVTSATDAPATADGDEKTFAVWDEARGLTAADDDVLLVVPPAERERARRRRQAALLGLGAAIILIAIAVIYLLTRDTSTNNTASTTPVTGTAPTTVPPTFLPGAQGGAPTTLATTPPTTTAAPAVPATPATTAAPPATTAPPAADPKSQITFPQVQGFCTNGQLSVKGTVANGNPQTYSFLFTVTFADSAGTVLGTANGSVAHEPPHSTGPFSASGSCTDVNGAASRTVQITQITPG